MHHLSLSQIFGIKKSEAFASLKKRLDIGGYENSRFLFLLGVKPERHTETGSVFRRNHKHVKWYVQTS